MTYKKFSFTAVFLQTVCKNEGWWPLSVCYSLRPGNHTPSGLCTCVTAWILIRSMPVHTLSACLSLSLMQRHVRILLQLNPIIVMWISSYSLLLEHTLQLKGMVDGHIWGLYGSFVLAFGDFNLCLCCVTAWWPSGKYTVFLFKW